MPHQCTTCGRTFPDGSKEMLSGCPDCGGNKFQFRPGGASDGPDASGETADASRAADRTTPNDASSGNDPGDSSPSNAPERTSESNETTRDTDAVTNSTAATDSNPASADEDGAQASARSDVVSKDELAAAAESTDRPGKPAADVSDATDDTADDEETDPNLDALRQKLNDQFESIRIVSPGKYELNLMELYDREEYIISLREDGRYVIEMPEGWDDR